MNKKEVLNSLPVEVMNKIKGILKAYRECDLYFENGRYEVKTGSILKAEYSNDYKFICTFYTGDIYSEIEMIENYINEFCDYPSDYKGKRDYAMLNKMRDEREYDFIEDTVTKWVGKINKEGNFVLTERIQE